MLKKIRASKYYFKAFGEPAAYIGYTATDWSEEVEEDKLLRELGICE